MYTSSAAYMQLNESNRGSIERGELAGVVEIDRDYLTCAPEKIKDIQPVITILNGPIAHSAQGKN